MTALQSCIRESGGTKSGVAALVDGSRSTNLTLKVGGFDETVSAILDTSRWEIQDGRFPDRGEEGSAREYAPVEVPEVAEFDALEPLPLKVRYPESRESIFATVPVCICSIGYGMYRAIAPGWCRNEQIRFAWLPASVTSYLDESGKCFLFRLSI